MIENGIDTDCYAKPHDTDAVRRRLGIPTGVPVIGTVGRLHEIKRQDVLLRAFARLHNRIPDAHLMLVGDGQLRHDLETLSDQLGIASRVHFVGYQARRLLTCKR